MPEFDDGGGLLQALRDEQIPLSTLEIDNLVAGGRRRVRARRWIGTAAAVAVVAITVPFLLTKARPPNQPPVTQPVVTPQAIGPTSCAVETLPAPVGYQLAEIYNGDTSGRYLVGNAHRDFGSALVLWVDGEPTILTPPGNSMHGVVNGSGVVTGSGKDVAWVYRNGGYRTLPQPPGDAFYQPVAINNKGQIVGAASLGIGPQTGPPPLIWGPDGTIVATADRDFMVRGIDDDGTVIGQGPRQYDGDLPGVLWRPGSPIADLPSPAGSGRAGAMVIRDGWIGGFLANPKGLDTETHPLKPFINHLGTGESLPVPENVRVIEDINSHGWAVVSYVADPTTNRLSPGLLVDGELVPLSLPSVRPPSTPTLARTISDDGRLLGGSGGDSRQAVIWRCR